MIEFGVVKAGLSNLSLKRFDNNGQGIVKKEKIFPTTNKK